MTKKLVEMGIEVITNHDEAIQIEISAMMKVAMKTLSDVIKDRYEGTKVAIEFRIYDGVDPEDIDESQVEVIYMAKESPNVH